MSRFSYLVDQPDIVGAWVYSRFPRPCEYVPGSCTAIGIVCAGEIVAGFVMTQYNSVNAWIEVAAVPGVNWCTRSVLKVVFGYPFVQLGLRRITCMVDPDNAPSIRFVEGVGFELETLLKDASPAGDLRIYRMTRERCRWIQQRPKHEDSESAAAA